MKKKAITIFQAMTMSLSTVCLMVCAALSSCSSDNEDAVRDSEQEGTARLRRLTIKDVSLTRATLTESATAMEAAWSAMDKLMCVNLSRTADLYFGEFATNTAGATSTFTGSIFCDNKDQLAVIFPAVAYPETLNSDKSYTVDLSAQDGTLSTIAARFHYVYGVATVAVAGNEATATMETMTSLLALCKFSFTTDGGAPIGIKRLTMGYGSSEYYPMKGVVTPSDNLDDVSATPLYQGQAGAVWKPFVFSFSAPQDGVYVALFPGGDTDSRLSFHFTVTDDDNKTYTGTAAAMLKAGKYYPVTLSCSEVTM